MIERLLRHLNALPDAAARLQFRLENMPLGYLATTEARNDIRVVLEERDRLHQEERMLLDAPGSSRMPITAAYLAVE